jgi:hypothetical protein
MELTLGTCSHSGAPARTDTLILKARAVRRSAPSCYEHARSRMISTTMAVTAPVMELAVPPASLSLCPPWCLPRHISSPSQASGLPTMPCASVRIRHPASCIQIAAPPLWVCTEMHNPAFPRAPQHLLRVVACWCGYVLRRELRGRSTVRWPSRSGRRGQDVNRDGTGNEMDLDLLLMR